jgi:cell division septal protein FtsQ
MSARHKREYESGEGLHGWRGLQTTKGRKGQRLQRRLRLRNWLRPLFYLLLIAALFGSGALLFKRGDWIDKPSTSEPIRAIIFDTDGVLDERWVSETLGLRAGTTLMEVDHFLLRDRLESEGQVRRATVERVFPATLRVRVEEHVPFFRMALADNDSERPEVWLVAEDGTLYKGLRYPRGAIEGLPWLIPYRHPDGSILPMNGIPRVADLMRTAKGRNPRLYRSWQVVSLENYTGELNFPGEIIEIRSSRIPRLILSANEDFSRQLDRLDALTEIIRSRGDPSIERIDLSLRGSAAVRFTSERVPRF